MEQTELTTESTTPPNEKATVRKAKAPSRYDLPSERFGMATHFNVLRRYLAATGNGNEAIAASKVEGNGVPVQSAVLNAGFMADIGLLTFVSRGVYKPTPAALQLSTAKSVSDDKARPILRGLIESTWFSDAAKNALGAKPFMNRRELLGDLAVTAQTDFEKKEKALDVLLEYLVYAGIVVKTEDGNYCLGSASAPSSAPAGNATPMSPMPGLDVVVLPKRESAATASQVPDVGDWEVIQTNDFYVRIKATKDALADLRDHLEIVEKKINRREAPKA